MAKEKETTDLKTEVEKSAKLFDVAKPGKTPASATSRPVIVGHKAIIKNDPMVTPEEPQPTNDTPVDDTSEPSRKSMTIAPLPKTEEADKAQPKEAEEAPAKEDTEPKEDQPSSTGAVDALVNEVTAKRQEQQEDEKQLAIQQEAQKLVASKKYFVPIKTQEQKRNTQILILFILLLVVVAGAALYIMGPGKTLLDSFIGA